MLIVVTYNFLQVVNIDCWESLYYPVFYRSDACSIILSKTTVLPK